MDYELRTTDYGLRTTNYGLRTTDKDYVLRTTYYVLRTTYYELRTTYYVLRTTDNGLRTTTYIRPDFRWAGNYQIHSFVPVKKKNRKGSRGTFQNMLFPLPFT